jgi:hypothetical protein
VLFTRQVIHLSNEEIVCLPWRRGQPLGERRFSTTPAGFADFKAYLRDWQNVPTRIAVDLIEEDFRVETLPHLRARDRKIVLERRLTQLYRATPFRAASLQGRESTGRRDDIALCTAITQSDSLVACLDALAHWRIPVLGVYPAAVLGETLLRVLRVEAEQLVLITLLRSDAIRISFFQKGRLKFSRISQPAAGEAGSFAGELREEVRRTLQYVSSQSWYLRGTAVRTLLVADPPEADTLAAVWSEGDPALQVVSPREIARRLGLRTMPAHSNATGLLLQLLMAQPPREQLAPRERTRDGRLWYARTALFSASALIAFGALVLAGFDFLQAFEVRDDTGRLASALAERRHAIATTQSQLPVSVVSPDRMSAVVRFERNERQRVPALLPFLQELAHALEGAPGLRLRRVSWTATARRPDPLSVPAAGAATPPVGRAAMEVISGLSPRTFWQEIRIEGQLDSELRSPGPAIAAVENFAASLRRQGLEAAVVRPPFDLDPARQLGSSMMGSSGRSPDFVLRLIGSERR